MYDVDACSAVQPGGDCVVRCRVPYMGGVTVGRCPAGNTDASTPLAWAPLACICPDPVTTPPAYTKTPGGWLCVAPYTGSAQLVCQSPSGCLSKPLLGGCVVRSPCAVQPFYDSDPRAGIISGRARFGPTGSYGIISENGIAGYQVLFADECGLPFGQPLAAVQSVVAALAVACCSHSIYHVDLPSTVVPSGATQLTVVAVTNVAASASYSLMGAVVSEQGGTAVPLEDLVVESEDAVPFVEGSIPEGALVVTMMVQGMSYDKLAQSPALLAGFEMAIRAAFAAEVGLSVHDVSVLVTMSDDGFPVVESTIVFPLGTPIWNVQQELLVSTTLGPAVVDQVSAVANINAAITGTVQVGNVEVMSGTDSATTRAHAAGLPRTSTIVVAANVAAFSIAFAGGGITLYV